MDDFPKNDKNAPKKKSSKQHLFRQLATEAGRIQPTWWWRLPAQCNLSRLTSPWVWEIRWCSQIRHCHIYRKQASFQRWFSIRLHYTSIIPRNSSGVLESTETSRLIWRWNFWAASEIFNVKFQVISTLGDQYPRIFWRYSTKIQNKENISWTCSKSSNRLCLCRDLSLLWNKLLMLQTDTSLGWN